MLPPPDMFVPSPAGSCILLDAGPPDHPCLYEKRQVAVHGDEGEFMALLPQELQKVVGMEMTLYIASCFQQSEAFFCQPPAVGTQDRQEIINAISVLATVITIPFQIILMHMITNSRSHPSCQVQQRVSIEA